MPPDSVDMTNLTRFQVNPCGYRRRCVNAPPPRDYRKTLGLPYPVNLARNIAWESSPTHYLLTSDIELLPSPNFIRDFLAFIRSSEGAIHATEKHSKVFVPIIFILMNGNYSMPQNKRELIQLEKKNIVRPFFKEYCPQCHAVPDYRRWIQDPSPGRWRLVVANTVVTHPHI